MRDPRVGGELGNFVAVRYDAERGEGKAVAQRFGVDGFPTFMVLDGRGRLRDQFVGFQDSNAMIARLRSNRGR